MPKKGTGGRLIRSDLYPDSNEPSPEKEEPTRHTVPLDRKKRYTQEEKDTELVPGMDSPASGKTQIFWDEEIDPNDFKKEHQPAHGSDDAAADVDYRAKAEVDLATGALVVVEGPGKGSVAIMGIGMNSAGRDSSQRVCLSFGDDTISRKNHFRLIYEPREGKYYVAPGDSSNLVYLNDGAMIAVVTPLKSGDTLKVGKTSLRFIAFCDDTFNWKK